MFPHNAESVDRPIGDNVLNAALRRVGFGAAELVLAFVESPKRTCVIPERYSKPLRQTRCLVYEQKRDQPAAI